MFKIGNRVVSNNSPPLIIVELGINHNGNISVAKKLVNSAKKAGAEIIKHQTHIAQKEMSLEAKKLFQFMQIKVFIRLLMSVRYQQNMREI